MKLQEVKEALERESSENPSVDVRNFALQVLDMLKGVKDAEPKSTKKSGKRGKSDSK